MAPRPLAVCWALGIVVASVAAETGSRQSLTARRATTAQQQTASEPCAIFDALTSPDQDCDYLVSYWGITLEDFVFWNPQVGDNCENISVGEGYCVKSTRTRPPSPPSKFNPDNGIETPSPTQPGMVGNCNKFHLVEDAATCEEIASYNKISLEELFAWNTGLDKDCTNLWRGTHACVGVVGEGTPLPVQPGMVDDCDEFHLVRETTTCQGMADYNDISLAEVLEWNTGLDSTCSNLWLGTYACVGVKGDAKAEAVEGMPSAFPETATLDLSNPTPLPSGITPAAAASSVPVLPLTPMMVEVPEGTPEPLI